MHNIFLHYRQKVFQIVILRFLCYNEFIKEMIGMRLSQVTAQLREQGYLDGRSLFSYATAVGTLSGRSFQNLMGVAFGSDTLFLFSAKTDGSIGTLLLSLPYRSLRDFRQKHRFLYSYTEFASGDTQLRFYNYNKKVFRQGCSDAGLEDKA